MDNVVTRSLDEYCFETTNPKSNSKLVEEYLLKEEALLKAGRKGRVEYIVSTKSSGTKGPYYTAKDAASCGIVILLSAYPEEMMDITLTFNAD